ncbi:MAG: 4Fe-4S binding protein [Pseudomonadota bacterium]|nr:4Fe-4S binding protein [Pseudomonadota bacterium]
MQSATKHLKDMVTQELRLPEIDADACVYGYYDQADCSACVDTCPTGAWVLNDESLGLDTDACDGCGLCIPACPGGALHIHLPWVIRPFSGRTIALFTCERSSIDRNPATLPCIHSLGLRQLLLLYNSGIEYLLIATAECAECTRHQPTGIHQRVEQLNKLLHERRKPPMSIIQRSDNVWMRIFKTDEMISRGTHLSRRKFLRGGGEMIRHQLVVADPLNLPECRTVPPGQWLPNAEHDEAHWPWTPRLDERRCNGCDACIKLCPTDALQLLQETNDEEQKDVNEDGGFVPAYRLNPSHCTGCGICATVCELQAITIHSFSLCPDDTIELSEKRCSACGNSYHLPRHNSQSEESLCRICREHNHSNNLYQVLADE